jgi:hypothetical protein
MDKYVNDILILNEPSDTSKSINLIILNEIVPLHYKCFESIRFHNPSIDINIFYTSNVIFDENTINNLNIKLYSFIILKKVNNEVIIKNMFQKFGGLFISEDVICIQSLQPLFDVFDYQCNQNSELYYEKDSFFVSLLNSKSEKIENRYKLSELNFNPYSLKELMEGNINNLIEKTQSSFGVNIYTRKIESNDLISSLINLGCGKIKLIENPIDQEINYINLFKRPERNLFFIATWSKYFAKINRFNAVITQGNINGCGKSHETIVRNSESNITIVLEDDAIPTKDFMNIFPNVLSFAKEYQNFDLLTLASPTLLNLSKKEFFTKKITPYILSIENCSSSHFIIYRKSILPYFDKFYEGLKNGSIRETNQDWYFNTTKEIRKLVSYPFLSLQYFGFVSDVVENTIRNNDFFSCGEYQLEIAANNSNYEKYLNLFKLIPKNKIYI